MQDLGEMLQVSKVFLIIFDEKTMDQPNFIVSSWNIWWGRISFAIVAKKWYDISFNLNDEQVEMMKGLKMQCNAHFYGWRTSHSIKLEIL